MFEGWRSRLRTKMMVLTLWAAIAALGRQVSVSGATLVEVMLFDFVVV